MAETVATPLAKLVVNTARQVVAEPLQVRVGLVRAFCNMRVSRSFATRALHVRTCVVFASYLHTSVSSCGTSKPCAAVLVHVLVACTGVAGEIFPDPHDLDATIAHTCPGQVERWLMMCTPDTSLWHFAVDHNPLHPLRS